VKYILGREGRALLAQFAVSRVLVAFDFDGTLAPIVAHRNRAVMPSSSKRLLTRLCALYPSAIISGRSRTDVRSRLTGIRVPHVVGNHGIEPARSISQHAQSMRSLAKELRTLFALHLDIDVEDKGYSLAIHYRNCSSRAAARRFILATLRRYERQIRIVGGKEVLNVLPEGAPNKGTALLDIVRKQEQERAIYIGDDVTDEDVFNLHNSTPLLTVRIGRSATSAAGYYLRYQTEIDALMAELIRLRASVR
jgi:trehalose 6-phosphate phosphatase